MNEILQKWIEAEARDIAELCPNCDFHCESPNPCIPKILYQKLVEMATFVLQNQWISVEEALPPIREKDIGNRSWSDWVLIMTHEGVAFMDCYAFHRKEWINNGNDVTHWMSIPQLKGGE